MKPDQLPSLLKAKTTTGIFVEVGTWEGDFSYELLEQTNCTKLYCVDPYKHFEDDSYPDGMNLLTQDDFETKFTKVKQRFSGYGTRVEFIRGLSHEAARQFQDESIDFVYIDGNHEYKSVLLDILAWYPKVKKGGLLCGDDVYSTDLKEHDMNGNVLRVWGRDVTGKPDCWGQYGTYKAVVDAQAILQYKFAIDQTQFIIHV
jgi:hypothetical protein